MKPTQKKRRVYTKDHAHKASKLAVGKFATFAKRKASDANRFYHHVRRNGGARMETFANSIRVYRTAR